MNCNALYMDGSDLSNGQVTSYMPANLVTLHKLFLYMEVYIVVPTCWKGPLLNPVDNRKVQ